MHREEEPLPPRRINPEIPEALEEITLKVLSKEPSARYRTADQLGRVLLSFGSLNKEKTGPIVLPQAGNNEQPAVEKPFVPPIRTNPPEIEPYPEPALPEQDSEEGGRIDWVTWGLGLLAFTAVLGLIPFWLFIYFSIRP
jgi:serine/threonine-protein kinase